MTLPSGSSFGQYEIRNVIGIGGMGEVYRAHDMILNRFVALKVLPSSFDSDPDRIARFRREAQLLAQLNHPSIASIYGLEESEGVQALVLELVEGGTLADRIKHGALPPPRHSASRGKSPKRCGPLTRKGSSTGISSRGISRSRRTGK